MKNGYDWRAPENRIELLGQIVDIFEDFLDERGIVLNNEDKEEAIRDGEDPDSLAILYGMEYAQIYDRVEETLANWGIFDDPKAEDLTDAERRRAHDIEEDNKIKSDFECVLETRISAAEDDEDFALRDALADVQKNELESLLADYKAEKANDELFDDEVNPVIDDVIDAFMQNYVPKPKVKPIPECIQVLCKKAKAMGAKVMWCQDIIDEKHLNCLWYGGRICEILYKQWVFILGAYGDIRVSVCDSHTDDVIADLVNKNNDGGIREIMRVIKDDDELVKLCCGMDPDRYITFENNNWLEVLVDAPDGTQYDTGWVPNDDDIPSALEEVLDNMDRFIEETGEA